MGLWRYRFVTRGYCRVRRCNQIQLRAPAARLTPSQSIDYPSVYEGFGLPILEAMSCGTPVVTSRGGATEEIAGHAALTVDLEDAKEMAEAIGSVLADASLRQRLRDAGQVRAQEFSWHRAAEETAAIYEKVAGKVQRST